MRELNQNNMKFSKKFFQIGNLLTPIIMFLILALISLGQGNFGQMFDQSGAESLIDPVNFAFGIWGVIFLFMFIFLIFQSRDLFKSRENKLEMPYVQEINFTFILSTIMAGLWYITWSYKIYWLATMCMIIYLVALIIGYLRLDINRKERPRKEKIAIVIPWSLYMGWVTAATIVSITTFLVRIGFNTPPIFPESVWAVLILIVTGIIYLSVLITRDDYIFAGVGIWTLFGIVAERLTASVLVFEVIITAVAGIVLLAGGMIYKFTNNH